VIDFRPFESVGGVVRELTDEEWAAHDAKIERERQAAEAKAEEGRQADLRRSLVERGCPAKDLERAISGDMSETQALVEARGALELDLVLLVLSGLRGCGKTTAAAWWLVQRRPPSKYVRTDVPRFVDATALARWPKYDNDQMFELERASALVVDDLGVEYDDKGGAFRSFLDGLVNARYAACLPTLITTNLRGDEFKARYGERIADRIRESGRYVELAGESLRRRA
jgi:DNA replication protein DnaC